MRLYLLLYLQKIDPPFSEDGSFIFRYFSLRVDRRDTRDRLLKNVEKDLYGIE